MIQDASNREKYHSKDYLLRLATSLSNEMDVIYRLILLINEVMKTYVCSWQIHHFTSFINILEVVHWYAYFFNENSILRADLKSVGFKGMNSDCPIPEFLQLEAVSIEYTLRWVFYLYDTHQLSETDLMLLKEHSFIDNVSIQYCNFDEKEILVEDLLKRYALIDLTLAILNHT